MGSSDERSFASCRTYFSFGKVNRLLHQNINRTLDVKQFAFETVQVMECRDGVGTTEKLGSGWLFINMQNGDAAGSGPGPNQQGFMSVDISVGNDLKSSMFVRGNIASNKTVCSVVSSHVSDNGSVSSTLLTVVTDNSSTLHITKVDNNCCRTSDGSSDDRRRDRSYDDDRKKRASTPSASLGQLSCSVPGYDPTNSAIHPRDPRIAGKPRDRRKGDDDCEYTVKGGDEHVLSGFVDCAHPSVPETGGGLA